MCYVSVSYEDANSYGEEFLDKHHKQQRIVCSDIVNRESMTASLVKSNNASTTYFIKETEYFDLDLDTEPRTSLMCV